LGRRIIERRKALAYEGSDTMKEFEYWRKLYCISH